MATTAVTIASESDLNTAIADGNAAPTQPTTGTFTTGFTEASAPTTITATAAADLVLDGANFTLQGDGTDAALIVGTSGAAAAVTIENLSITNSGAAAIHIALGSTVTFEAGANTDLPTIGTISAPIAGGGGITVVVAADVETTQAPLVLSAVNTYTGATVIDAPVDLGANGSIATSASVTFGAAAGVLDVSGAQTSTGAATSVVLNNLSGTGADGAIYLGHNSIAVTETSALTFGGVIADQAPGGPATNGTQGGLTVEAGAGSLKLTGVETYTGATKVYGDLILGSGGSIAESSNVSLKAAGAIFDVTAAGATINALSGVAGTTVSIGTEALTVTQDATASFSGVISGTTGSFTVDGTDTLTLSGVETYTGETAVNGSLALTGSGSIATSTSLTLGSGFDESAAFDISGASGTVTVQNLGGYGTVTLGANKLVDAGTNGGMFFGVISGSGGLAVGTTANTTGSHSTLELFGDNTYTGATQVYGQLDIVDGGSISDSSGVSLKISGAALLVDSVDATPYTVASTGETFAGTDINALSGVAMSSVVLDESLIVHQTVAATFSGVISGGSDLVVAGSQTLTLAGVNTFDGETHIDGSLALTGAGSIANSYVVDDGVFNISAASGTVSITGLTSDVASASVVLGANTLNITSDQSGYYYAFFGVISGSGGVTLTGGYLEVAGANTYTGVTTITGGTLEIDNGGSIANSSSIVNSGSIDVYSGSATIGQVISGTGAVDVHNAYDNLTDTYTGAGSLTLTGADTYTGTTLIVGGDEGSDISTLFIGAGGSIADSSDVVLDGDATLDISQASGTVTLQVLTDEGGIGGNDSLILGNNSLILAGTTSSLFSGVISGAGGIQINTGATLVLDGGADTYTGVTKVYGHLELEGGATLASAVSLKVSGAELEIGAGYTTATKAVINELTGVAGSEVMIDGGSVLKIVETTAASYSGTIAETGTPASVYFDGTATLTLFGTETYTGATVVNGSLALGTPTGSSIQASIADSSSVTVNGTFTTPASTTVENLSGTGTINITSGTLSDTVTATTGSFATAALSGAIQGAGVLAYNGTATTGGAPNTSSLLTLSHANTVGGIHLGGGTLELATAGSAGSGTITFTDTNSSAVLQIDNAALTGSGTATESFANTIAGMSANDIIDLSGLSFSNVPGGSSSSVAFTGGNLVVTEGNVSVTLHISGLTSTIASYYHAFEDSHGGTYIIESTAPGYTPTHYHP